MTNKKLNNAKNSDTKREKQQDQVLGGFAKEERVYGKISSPQPKPQIQAEKPAITADKPVKSVEKAVKTVEKSTITAEKPAKPVKKPVHKSDKVQGGKNATAKPLVNGIVEKKQPMNKGRKNGKPQKKLPSVKAYFLGGLNEIGKNFTLFECQGDMIIVDCGLAFPDDHMLGIDIVIPEFTFIEKNIDKIKGVVITHGHEDHIGSVPYLLKKFNLPVYGTPLTLGLIKVKLKEHGLNPNKLHNTMAGSKVKLGCFNIEFIRVNHSISDAVGLALHTPAGVIVHTGDFKIDFTPPAGGEVIDLARFAELGKSGVLALMADSTNVERAGYTASEQKVAQAFERLFASAEKKRIIVASFASNISRVQQVINCAIKYGRKVALSGRSMVNVMQIATELGYLKVPDGLFIDLALINRYEKDKVVLITTGSQGEPMAALSRMAFAEHRQVEVDQNDFIIISAKPIPGNEKSVGAVVDELLKRGCEVVYESMYEVHVSGHACQEELKLMHCLTKPQYFIPVHGEHKHLRKHATLAMEMGMEKENIFIGDIGKGIEINRDFIKPTQDVPAGEVMVDGIGVGDVGSIVLRDRELLGNDGLIIAVCTIDTQTHQLVSGPDIVSRGFVYVRESEEMMDNARKIVYNAVQACVEENLFEWNVIKLKIRDGLSKYLYEKTRRKPMILPIIMEI